MSKKFTKKFMVLAKAFQEFSFSEALLRKKDLHDEFGDEEHATKYMDVDDEGEDDEEVLELPEALKLDEDDCMSDCASLAPSADEIQDGVDCVVSEWSEFSLELPCTSPTPEKNPSVSASPPVTNAGVELNSKARRKLARNAGMKGIRSGRRQGEWNERNKVSINDPTETAPLQSKTHLAPHKIRSSTSKAYLKPQVISGPKANLRTHSTQPAYVCKRLDRSEGTPPLLKKLKDDGFKVVPVVPNRNRCILDSQRRLVVGIAAPPKDKTPTEGRRPPESWKTCMHHCTEESVKANAECELTPEDNARGDFVVLNVGCTHGNGTTEPVNRVFPNRKARRVAERLRRNPRFRRIASFQDALLRFYAPKLASFYDETLEKLYQHDRTLRRPFPCSTYPSVAFNIDPTTVCRDHTDAGNFPANLCAITAFGNYDYKLGGHLILYDLKLIIEFPSGYTILMPSGAMRHGNTAIGKDETRFSMVQYCPGGLIRWVEHGFKPASHVGKRLREAEIKKRWEKVINLLSKLDELEEDHRKARS